MLKTSVGIWFSSLLTPFLSRSCNFSTVRTSVIFHLIPYFSKSLKFSFLQMLRHLNKEYSGFLLHLTSRSRCPSLIRFLIIFLTDLSVAKSLFIALSELCRRLFMSLLKVYFEIELLKTHSHSNCPHSC